MWFRKAVPIPAWADRRPFKTLTRAEVAWLQPWLAERTFASGERVVSEGDAADGFYVVLGGQLEVARTANGQRHVVATLGPDELVGELAVTDGQKRSASVTATTNARLVFFPEVALREAMSREDSVARNVFLKLSQGLSSQIAGRLRSQLEAATASAHERLVLGEFTVNVLILVCLYVLFENALPSIRHYLPASTTVISLPLIILFGLAAVKFMRSSGYPASFFGLGLRHSIASLFESVVFTVPFLAIITGAKALLVVFGSGAQRVIAHPDVLAHLSDPNQRTSVVVYVASSLVQELIVRSVLQSTLLSFLPGRSGAIRAVVVCALLFSVSHLHISFAFALATFLPGLFWGWLYHRRRNLIGPTLSHLVIGGYVFFILGW